MPYTIKGLDYFENQMVSTLCKRNKRIGLSPVEAALIWANSINESEMSPKLKQIYNELGG